MALMLNVHYFMNDVCAENAVAIVMWPAASAMLTTPVVMLYLHSPPTTWREILDTQSSKLNLVSQSRCTCRSTECVVLHVTSRLSLIDGA